jgi:hypothetical protein
MKKTKWVFIYSDSNGVIDGISIDNLTEQELQDIYENASPLDDNIICSIEFNTFKKLFDNTQYKIVKRGK